MYLRPSCFMHVAFPYIVFLVSGEVMGSLGIHEELAAGASLGRVGLEAPPLPSLVGTTPCPTIPELEHGLGSSVLPLCSLLFPFCFVDFTDVCAFFLCFFILAVSDSTISGWADAIHAVYSDVGG